MIRFGSVCSGIEAASVAWHPLGWKAAWLSEIEPFPCAVLAHHYPDVRNVGDMTQLPEMVRAGEVDAPDVFTGGTPCQAFSVAGKRGSLSDARGNLSLTFVEIANAVDDVRTAGGRDACVVVWENVPGVLSTTDNAFGCFIGALAGADDALVAPAGDDGKPKWSDAGVVLGPRRAVCWRIIDAQFFGLAQRRRRVFVVASARNGFDPATVLLEFDGVRRDSAPRREAREGTAGHAEAGAGVGGGPRWPAEIASTLNAKFGDKLGLEDQHALNGAPLFVPERMGTLTARMMCSLGSRDVEDGALLAVGFDAYNQVDTEHAQPVAFAQNQRDEVRQMDIAGALAAEPGAKQQTYIAFSSKDHGGDAGDIAPTLRSMGHDGSHANGGGQVAVAFGGQMSTPQVDVELSQTLQAKNPQAAAIMVDCYNGAIDGEVGATLGTRGSSVNSTGPTLMHGMSVRRLTPRECERLQGFPDDYTAIPWRGKPADACPDGPRYKALGNSWAVPCARWIGRRIAAALGGQA
jgi:DNA (cytosine-5)-methyltransferase 1